MLPRVNLTDLLSLTDISIKSGEAENLYTGLMIYNPQRNYATSCDVIFPGVYIWNENHWNILKQISIDVMEKACRLLWKTHFTAHQEYFGGKRLVASEVK